MGPRMVLHLAEVVALLGLLGATGATLDLTSSLLPSSLPPGDPSNFALPVFLLAPSSTFTSRDKPATLRCRAAHALQVSFWCDGEAMAAATEEEGVEEASGSSYREVSIQVRKGQVLDTLEEYSCTCRANSSRGEVESPPALVALAYLRKDFETPPYSTMIALGSQAELRCHPPAGRPQPRVRGWLRNGVPIQTGSGDSNFIISSTGHLLLLQASLSDTANYTCVAANTARQRTSPPALVTVYIPGSWSEWGKWTSCNVECGRGLQVRQRTCDSPAPVNGGPGCEGPAIQKRSCQRACPGVHGAWAPWGAWAACSTDCLQVRRRSCSSPTPSNGGRYCQGKDMASRACSSGACRPAPAESRDLPVLAGPDAAAGLSTSDLTDRKSVV